MNSLHKILGFLMVLMLATFALPSYAAQTSTTKYFSTTAPTVVPNGPTLHVQFTFLNATPKPGVSTINSVLITPPPYVTIDCSSIKLLGATKSGTGIDANDGLNSCIVNNFTGIPSGGTGVFDFTTNANAPTCASGMWASQANAGNTYPQGTAFAVSPTGTSTPSSDVGCDGTVACGGSIDASINGAGVNDPGYAKITIGTTLKDGAACTGPIGFDTTNTLVNGNNKLVVVLSDPKAAFTAVINSAPLPLDSTGYASLRVKVAWEKNGNGDWIYINAPTCVCSNALTSCMPIDLVSTDPYYTQQVKACVADYMWVLTSSGLAQYSATIVGVGNDPAFGWE